MSGYGIFIMAMRESAGWMSVGSTPTGDYCEFSHFMLLRSLKSLVLWGCGTKYEFFFNDDHSMEEAYGDLCKALSSGSRFVRFHSVDVVKESKE